MGMWKRISLIFKAKANRALDRAEDPRETLDYSYAKQLEMLQRVKHGVVEVATSRKRLELQQQQLTRSAATCEDQARQALAMGREDLAREVLLRRSAIKAQATDLDAQHADLAAQEEKLTLASQRLSAQVEAFRTRKETIKASYTAAEAQTRINEAVTGISAEMSEVSMAVQRAEDKTQQLQARAGAIDELIAAGTLGDPAIGAKDDVAAELARLSSTTEVELEMTRMKAELAGGSAPPKELGTTDPAQGS